MIILLAVGACSGATRTPGTTGVSASAVAITSTGPGGHPPTLTGSGSTFDAPFFSVAFARYQQQHPGVTISYAAVGSSAGIAAFSASQADFGASAPRSPSGTSSMPTPRACSCRSPAAAVLLAWWAGFGSVAGIILLVVAGIAFVTGTVGYCPTYQLFRFSTRPSPHRISAPGLRAAAHH